MTLVEFNMRKGQFIALSPKCYMAYNEETKETKLGTKGVPRSSKLELQNFLDKLYFGTSHCVEIRSLRMINNRMARTKQKRSALSDLFLKFAVQNDRISCAPLCENGEIL